MVSDWLGTRFEIVEAGREQKGCEDEVEFDGPELGHSALQKDTPSMNTLTKPNPNTYFDLPADGYFLKILAIPLLTVFETVFASATGSPLGARSNACLAVPRKTTRSDLLS